MKLTRNLIALGWLAFALLAVCRLLKPESFRFVTPLVAGYILFFLTKATIVFWIVRIYVEKILKKIEAESQASAKCNAPGR